MENPIKMDDLEVPLFLETSICQFGDFTHGTWKTWKWYPKQPLEPGGLTNPHGFPPFLTTIFLEKILGTHFLRGIFQGDLPNFTDIGELALVDFTYVRDLVHLLRVCFFIRGYNQ